MISDRRGNLKAAPIGNVSPKNTETKLKLNRFRLPLQKQLLQIAPRVRWPPQGTFLELAVISGCIEFLHMAAKKRVRDGSSLQLRKLHQLFESCGVQSN